MSRVGADGRARGSEARALNALAAAGVELTAVLALDDDDLVRLPGIGRAAARTLRSLAASAAGDAEEARRWSSNAAVQRHRDAKRAEGLAKIELWVPVELVEQARRVVAELAEQHKGRK